MTVMKPKSMQEAAQAIRGRIASLVKKEAEQIKDPEQRRLFKASMLGSAHMEPGTHEPEQAGVPEHMEPGNHEQMAPSDDQPPADESQPVAGGLGVPGGDLQGDSMTGGQENGTVDMCPLCQQPDEPGSCTCLETMAQGGLAKMGDAMGADMTGPAGPGVMDGPLMRSELCKTCGASHKPWEGHSKAVKKTVANPSDPQANSNKPGAGSTLDSRAGLGAHGTSAARAGPRSPQLSKAVDDPGTVPDPKSKTLPKDKAGKEIKNAGNGGEKKNKPTKAPALSKGWPQSDAENRSNKGGFGADNVGAAIGRDSKADPKSKLPTQGGKPVPDQATHSAGGVSRTIQGKAAGLPAAAPKGPHEQLANPHTPNSGSPHDKAAEAKYWQSVKKADVPTAKPPSGKVPGGTGAPPMASNNSAPKIGAPAAPAVTKPPPMPGAPKPLGKAAPPPGAKQQMNTHMMAAASQAAAKPPPAAKPTMDRGPAQAGKDMAWLQGAGSTGVTAKPLPGLIPSGGKAPTPNVPAGKGAGIPGFTPGATGAAPGGSFQPQPIKVPPKPAGISAPGPAVAPPKRSLFTALFGPKR